MPLAVRVDRLRVEPPKLLNQTAVVFALFNADSYRYRLLEAILDRLQLQTSIPYLGLGVLNHSKAVVPEKLKNRFHSFIEMNGNPDLFQKEAIWNAVVSTLPKTIENLVFLDADIFPLDSHWIQKIEKKLTHYELVQAYTILFYLTLNSTQKVLHSPTMALQHGDLVVDSCLEYVDRKLHTETVPLAYPSFAYTRGLKEIRPGAMGGAIAFRRNFFEKIGGFPYEEIFGGLNDVLLFYRLGLCPREWASFLPEPLLEITAELPQARLGFVNERLYHLFHGPGEKRDYDARVAVGKELGLNPLKHLYLNPTGGIELTEEAAHFAARSKEIHERHLSTKSLS